MSLKFCFNKKSFFSPLGIGVWVLLPIAYCLLPTISSKAQSPIIKYAREIIDTLAAPGMHGRGYVNKGDSLAALYIKNEFIKIGVKPLGKEFYQEFNLNVNTFPGGMSIRSEDKELIAGKDFIVRGISGSVTGTFKTLWFNSKNLSSKKAKNKFKKTNFSNKVVLLDKKGLEKLTDSKELLEAFEHNLFKASAVIFIEDNKLTAGYSGRQMQFPMATMLREATKSISDSISINIQNSYLTNYQTQNILGFIPGTQYPDSFILFSAHYDHLGRMGKDVYFPGANDNASGCGMLLNLAKYYSEHPPKFSIAFMAFGAEEIGLLGSEYYVAHSHFPLKRIKFLINMDIMGTGDEGIKVVNATEHKKEFEKLVEINKEKNYLSAVHPRGKAANSDHYHFSEAGVKAFFIYTLGGIKAYHDIYDRRETLPLTKFEETFKLLTEFSEYLQK